MALSYIDWERNGVLVFSLTGRLTLGEGTRILRDIIREALSTGARSLVLNLKEVVYVDSAGLGELVAVQSQVVRQGGRLKLASLGERATGLMQLTRLYTIFEIYDSEDDAVASFGPAA